MFSLWVPVSSLIVAMALWSSSFIALKMAFIHYDPMVVIFGRMLVAAICFVFVLKAVAKFEYRKGDWRWLLLMVFSEPCLYFLFEAHALQNTSATQAGMITALAPLLVAMGALIFLAERLHKMAWIGFTVAVAGALWLSVAGSESESAPHPLLGNFLEFCAMVCATCYTLCLKHLSTRYSTWFLTAMQAFCGTVFFLPFLFLPGTQLPTEFIPEGVWPILYLGTLINIGAYGLFNFGVSRINAGQASAFINLIPVFTLALAFWLLGERLNGQQLVASLLVLGGVLLSQWQPRKRKMNKAIGKVPATET